jgi:hypothetical protein
MVKGLVELPQVKVVLAVLTDLQLLVVLTAVAELMVSMEVLEQFV